jgi:hypothetical protein
LLRPPLYVLKPSGRHQLIEDSSQADEWRCDQPHRNDDAVDQEDNELRRFVLLHYFSFPPAGHSLQAKDWPLVVSILVVTYSQVYEGEK